MNLPLIEKYRPITFDDVVGVEDLETIKELVKNPKDLPSLLFHGSSGTGKTTCAKIIIDSLKPVDVLRINGSDTTGVDTIRDSVLSFITSTSLASDKPKIVWIEEFDYMSSHAFAALRSMMEQYVANARFLCTCNYLAKIPEEIRSRFSMFEFTRAEPKSLYNRIKHICDREKITVSENAILSIIEHNRGDIRATINMVQKLSSNNTRTIIDGEENSLQTISEEVFSLLLSSDWSKLRYDIPLKNPDYNKLFSELDNLVFSSDLTIVKKAHITEQLSRGMFEMAFAFDKDICFAATMSRIITVLTEE